MGEWYWAGEGTCPYVAWKKFPLFCKKQIPLKRIRNDKYLKAGSRRGAPRNDKCVKADSLRLREKSPHPGG